MSESIEVVSDTTSTEPTPSVEERAAAASSEEEDIARWLRQSGVASLRDLYALVVHDPDRAELSRVLMEIEQKNKILDAYVIEHVATTRAHDEYVRTNARENPAVLATIEAARWIKQQQVDILSESISQLRVRANELAEKVREADAKLAEERKLATEKASMSNIMKSYESGTYALQDAVRRFMTLGRQNVATKIGLPDVPVLKLRLRMLGSEYFEAVYATCSSTDGPRFEAIEKALFEALDAMTVVPEEVDFSGLIDASLDMDYVSEGLRIECGVDGVPLARAVAEANLAKVDGPNGPIFDERGKIQKPEGWQPPDITGLLMNQGWEGPPRRAGSEDAPPITENAPATAAAAPPVPSREMATAPATPIAVQADDVVVAGSHLRPKPFGRHR